jgi:hypothetical protein
MRVILNRRGLKLHYAMANLLSSLPDNYWQDFNVTKKDNEYIQNYLFETETPLTARDLVQVIVAERLKSEKQSAARKQLSMGKIYLPKDHFQTDDSLAFPALNWKKGVVASIRPGSNPEIGNFDVIEVTFEDGDRKLFASGLESHVLNAPPQEDEAAEVTPDVIIDEFGDEIEKKISNGLSGDESLVSIAGYWFPRALLLDVNVGHLNLVEAILEMAGGEPMTSNALLEQIDLGEGVNPKLAEFSLNYALQEDKRFDEVGPAGQVLWVLERLEPDEVRHCPSYLQYKPVEYDASALTPQMLELESELDDELSSLEHATTKLDQVTICLTYPHWRAGTLPISNRLQSFFPTAYQSPRVRFTLVDVKNGERIPAWVVRQHGFVYGLAEWFKRQKLFPGALISFRRSKQPGEVVIEAMTHKPTREWVRTVLSGSDGGLVFAVLKQDVGCDFNERMVAIVSDSNPVDLAWEQVAKNRQPFEKTIAAMIRELSKLTPQGHVHAQELYSAINILRRTPPAPLMATLATDKSFKHIGDLYFRLNESEDN